MTAAIAAAPGGRGTLIVVTGPAGIGKSTMLRAAGAEADARGVRTLTARGLALERGFAYGIVRQLLEPVHAAAGPGEWDALLEGAARLARPVFDGAEPNAAGVPHAVVYGLYRLAANLAARGPLLLAVDDAHWADEPSLRWLSHLAARIEGLPAVLLLGTRSGPDQPEVMSELADDPACIRLALRPLGGEAVAALVMDGLGDRASQELSLAAQESTGGNPFLLDALIKAARNDSALDAAALRSLGPRPVADAVTRRIGQLDDGGVPLGKALAVLARPAPLRQVAALADMELAQAALITDRLRAASVLAAGALLEFEQPIVRNAIYDSIPPGERAMAHARAAALLAADGADTELVGPHLLRSEPGAAPHAVAVLRAAAASARGRGATAAAADYLRRALAEPPPAQERAALLLDLGLVLASDRDEAAVGVLREAVAQAADASRPALLASVALATRGYHDIAAEIARAGLAAPAADPLVLDQLESELFVNSWPNAATAGRAWERIRPRLDAIGTAPPATVGARFDWHVYDALSATLAARPGTEVMARLGPVLAAAAANEQRDSLRALLIMLVLTWNDEFTQAQAFGDVLLADARARGSANMIPSLHSVRSLILRRLGRLRAAAEDGRVGFDFALKSSPPLAVAWTAALLVEALTRIGRFGQAEKVVAAAQERRSPDGWIHTIMFTQARGALRVAAQRHEEGLADLLRAADDWRALGVSSPAAATWRIPAVAAYSALGRQEDAERLAAEQLELALAVGTPATLGVALRIAAPFAPDPESTLAEAIALLDAADGRYDQGARARRPRRAPSPGRAARRGEGAAAPRARLRGTDRRRAVARLRAGGTARGRRPPPARRAHRPRRADGGRTPGSHPGRGRTIQPADRAATVHHPGDRGDPPAARLPQARHHLARRPARAADPRA